MTQLFGLPWYFFGILIFIGFFVGGLTLGYLRKSRDNSKQFNEELSQMRRSYFEAQQSIRALTDEVNQQRTRSTINFTEHEKDTVKSQVLSDLSDNLSEEVLLGIKESLRESKEKDDSIDLVALAEARTTDRLTAEIAALVSRGNVNLFFGIVITIIGISLLWLFLGKSIGAPDAVHYLMEFGPRLSLVILVEVFAYFFLKLYKSNLSEIKYLHNELTSMEGKFLSLRVAILGKSKIQLVANKFSGLERNFILSKGQTTIELERVKREGQAELEILSKLVEIARAKFKVSNEKEGG
jgi:hypothetical protein